MISTLPLKTRPIGDLMLDNDEMVDYVSRWRDMVEARRQQIEAQRQGRSRHAPANGQLRNFHQSLTYTGHDIYGRPMRDPFLAHVSEKVYPRMTVLDVGAGTGRFAVPLARQAYKLVATEPEAMMRRLLEDNCAAAQLKNVTIVDRTWPEGLDVVGLGQADITICSHVLYPISNVQPFITALEQATRVGGYIFLYLWVGQRPDYTTELWQALHGEVLHRHPDYRDAYNVLGQMGIAANVTIVNTWLRWRFDQFDDALAEYCERLCLNNNADKRSVLAAHLHDLLTEDNGALTIGKPNHSQAAIIWWQRG